MVWAGGPDTEAGTIFFATRERRLEEAARTRLAPGFNRFELHDWAGAPTSCAR